MITPTCIIFSFVIYYVFLMFIPTCQLCYSFYLNFYQFTVVLNIYTEHLPKQHHYIVLYLNYKAWFSRCFIKGNFFAWYTQTTFQVLNLFIIPTKEFFLFIHTYVCQLRSDNTGFYNNFKNRDFEFSKSIAFLVMINKIYLPKTASVLLIGI